MYLLEVQGTLKSLRQHQNSKASILRHSVFFIVQLSHPYMTTGKTIALTRWTFAGKVTSLLFNRLSRLVIAFLPRSSFNFMAAVTICRDFIYHSPDPPLHRTPSGLCVLSAWNSLSLSNGKPPQPSGAQLCEPSTAHPYGSMMLPSGLPITVQPCICVPAPPSAVNHLKDRGPASYLSSLNIWCWA